MLWCRRNNQTSVLLLAPPRGDQSTPHPRPTGSGTGCSVDLCVLRPPPRRRRLQAELRTPARRQTTLTNRSLLWLCWPRPLCSRSTITTTRRAAVVAAVVRFCRCLGTVPCHVIVQLCPTAVMTDWCPNYPTRTAFEIAVSITRFAVDNAHFSLWARAFERLVDLCLQARL